MSSQAAEQIIAGVVLSERLAVTMYGAIHRAQWGGQRNLRGLVIDPKMLAETSFRASLTDAKAIAAATKLDHGNIVPTVAVEAGGPDVVVVTRGVGRYVTVQDLIAAARAVRSAGGKLTLPVAAAIGKSVVEALAVAHKAGVVHGAVHPRSVLVDEDGAVRLGDFIVGRALTTAVAQGADSTLWRGLAGFLAPELVVGEDPSPGSDVFAVGALLFTMLSGEVPPGTLHVTPAVERLVQRALDTDLSRRYRSATDLLENLLEAFEDDRWEIAARGDVIKAAGLSSTDTNVDEATEDLLASLGGAAGKLQVTPIRPSMDIRAEAVANRHSRTPTTGSNKLQSLLDDLDDSKEHTTVEDKPFKRDPISELIQRNPRKSEAIVQVKPRVPSLDDPDDDETPLPPPSPHHRDSDHDLAVRPNTRDESAAMNALAELDMPAQRMTSAAEQAQAAAVKLEQAARRAEAAAARVETNSEASARTSGKLARPPIVDPIQDFNELPPPRLKSRLAGILALLVVAGGGAGFYMIYKRQQEERAAQDKRRQEDVMRADEQTRLAQQGQADPGTIRVSTSPMEASVWLKLGRTPLDSVPLSSAQLHRIRIELDGYQGIDTEVVAANWSGEGFAKKATVNVMLKAAARDRKGKSLAEPLPSRPPNLVEQKGFTAGEGVVHVESTPPGAEVWLLIGIDQKQPFTTIAGRPYELRALADGFKPAYVSITAEEWRDGGDTSVPIDRAKKKKAIDKQVELQVDPDAKPKKGR